MYLAIAGKNALVCAASRGLGKACAMSLAREGARVVIVARNSDALHAAAEEIRTATKADVMPVAADITSEEGRQTALRVCAHPDILINNAGGPPPGDFREWDQAMWFTALNANMLTPIALIKAVVDGMIERRFGRIVNITSSAVKAPIPMLGLSNGARSGLTGFVAGLARQTVQHNVTINNLLPGEFLTDRLRSNYEHRATTAGRSAEELMAEKRSHIPAGRFGDPAEFGEFCAFLCSSQAGYLTGQNILLDGGTYPGTY
jgi:3-oxoacyl-[acyl-carrier protein] reductase